MKLFGLPLDSDWSIYGLSYSRWIFPTFCTLSLMFGSIFNVIMSKSVLEANLEIVVLGLNVTLFEEFSRMTLAGISGIFYCRFMLSAVPAVFAFHVYVTRNWEKLWLNLLKIQEDMELTRDFLKQCKKRCCYLTFALMILVCVISICHLIIDINPVLIISRRCTVVRSGCFTARNLLTTIMQIQCCHTICQPGFR